MIARLLSVAAYVVVTLAVQGLNHFVVNTGHYARQPLMSDAPTLWGGVAATLVQGCVAAFFYARLRSQFAGVRGALAFSLLMGLFLGSYIALGEPSKFSVSSMGDWFAVEAAASLVQFALFGLAIGFIYKHFKEDRRG